MWPFKSKREILGYKPKKIKEGEGNLGWWMLLPLLLLMAYLLWEFWLQNMV